MTDTRKVVLASQSPRRRELLSDLISGFRIIPDNSPETVDKSATPEETVKRLPYKRQGTFRLVPTVMKLSLQRTRWFL